jgi:hypothetical protein
LKSDLLDPLRFALESTPGNGGVGVCLIITFIGEKDKSRRRLHVVPSRDLSGADGFVLRVQSDHAMAETALIAELLFLLTVANGSPVVAKRLLLRHFAHPLDFGRQFTDGRPILGASKTFRGVFISISATALAAVLIGETAAIGLVIGVTSMAGDLLSSFVKRRLGLPPSSQALGLDQIPEAFLPALAAMPLLGLSLAGAAIVAVLFFAGALVLSRWLYRVGVRDHPH